jgi:hypothetical protein
MANSKPQLTNKMGRERVAIMSLSECHDLSSIGTLPQATNPAGMNAKVDQVVTNSKTDSLREKK